LRSIASGAIGELERRDSKPYSAFASKTEDDYFDVDISDIPRRVDRRRRTDDPEAFEIASALAMIADCDSHPTMSAKELRQADPSLYAIVFEAGGGYAGFVRNVSPRRSLRPGLRYLQYDDTLKRIEAPDLVIDGSIDMVVTTDQCAVLSPIAFASLFGDVGVVFQQAPENLKALSRAMKAVIPLSAGALEALQSRCGRRVSDARRLHHIVTDRATALAALSADELTGLLQLRGLEDALANGQLNLSNESVSDFLDLVEGRLFTDDLTQEERRADSYSPRRR
jgi:hypothetical protein